MSVGDLGWLCDLYHSVFPLCLWGLMTRITVRCDFDHRLFVVVCALWIGRYLSCFGLDGLPLLVGMKKVAVATFVFVLLALLWESAVAPAHNCAQADQLCMGQCGVVLVIGVANRVLA